MDKEELQSILENEGFYKIEDDDCLEDEFEYKFASYYLGSYMYLDPCGKYHHILSPNGITDECIEFWENLEDWASDLECWIECGEGDPTDIYLVTTIDNIPEDRLLEI